ncbi:MAG: hypothetical protein ACOVP4_04610 [Bacteriovoracaceae bacterium]
MAAYKRSIFLVDPKFQVRFSLTVASLVFLTSLIYPIIFMDFINEIAKLTPALTEQLQVSRNQLVLFLMIIQMILTLIVFIIFIFMTHKVAGPMYKLKTHLNGIREGENISPLRFRSGDYFQDVADDVSLFLETVQLNQENDFLYLEEVAQYIQNLSPVVPDDKKPILNEISNKLREIGSRYTKEN